MPNGTLATDDFCDGMAINSVSFLFIMTESTVVGVATARGLQDKHTASYVKHSSSDPVS